MQFLILYFDSGNWIHHHSNSESVSLSRINSKKDLESISTCLDYTP